MDHILFGTSPSQGVVVSRESSEVGDTGLCCRTTRLKAAAS